MRSVESDTVILSEDDHIASEEAELALKTRFPNAMRWLLGGRECGVIHGDQIKAILAKEDYEEFDGNEMPDATDAVEIRALIRFLRENWIQASRVHYLGYEDWETIFNALRWCAEEIGYLPQSKSLEKLRENSVCLSGKLISYRYYRPSTPGKGWDNPGPDFYEYDWIVILRACQFAVENLNPQNDKMAEVKQKLEDLTPKLLERVKQHSSLQGRRWGLDSIEIHRRLNEIEESPWNYKGNFDLLRNRYRELRKLQCDNEETPDDMMRVLRFTVRDGAVVKIYDRLGKYKATEVIPEDSHCSFRDHDVDYHFASETLTIGKGIQDRMVINMDDVTISESEIVYCDLEHQPEFLEYIYANYDVKKYRRPKERE